MEKLYESYSEKDSIEASDHGTSRVTTTGILDFTKEIIKPIATTVYQSYLNLTYHNLPISLQETLDVDHNYGNTPWKNALDSEYD